MPKGIRNPNRVCTIKGCERPVKIRGWCNRHYLRWYRYGDPEAHVKYVRGDDVARFWNHVDKNGPVVRLGLTPCMIWTGNTRGGYGRFFFHGALRNAHRVAWELAHGPIPVGLDVLHHCDNPPCVNEEHLFLGTNADNVADKEAKGRGNQPKGAQHSQARLTDVDVLAIRAARGAGALNTDLAREYDVTPTQIGRIVNRQAWTHI